MSETDVLRTVREYLGDHWLTDPEHMSEYWNVSPYQDAWLARPKKGSRGGLLFLVRMRTVQPFQLAEMSLDQAYERLVSQTSE